MAERDDRTARTSGMTTWRAGCGESRTSGSEGGPEKPTSRKTGRALRPDPYTYLPTWEGWLYLATVIDIASRRVVGFALAEHLRTELVADALTNAVAARDPEPGVVFHSDKGCQYVSGDYATLAEELTITLSVGRTGQCWDNALAESFFASLKGECLDQQPWPTRAAARHATVEYIAWFNGTRLHSALGYMTPNEFEATTDQEVIKQVA